MQCRGPGTSSSEVLLNLKQVCSAIHLLQYIEKRTYLVPKVFHQQDLTELLSGAKQACAQLILGKSAACRILAMEQRGLVGILSTFYRQLARLLSSVAWSALPPAQTPVYRGRRCR